MTLTPRPPSRNAINYRIVDPRQRASTPTPSEIAFDMEIPARPRSETPQCEPRPSSSPSRAKCTAPGFRQRDGDVPQTLVNRTESDRNRAESRLGELSFEVVPTVDMPRLLVGAGPCMLPEGPTLHDLGPASITVPMAGLKGKTKAKPKLRLLKPTGQEAAANARHASIPKPNRPQDRVATQAHSGGDSPRRTIISRGLTVNLGSQTHTPSKNPPRHNSIAQGLKKPALTATMPAAIGNNDDSDDED